MLPCCDLSGVPLGMSPIPKERVERSQVVWGPDSATYCHTDSDANTMSSVSTWALEEARRRLEAEGILPDPNPDAKEAKKE